MSTEKIRELLNEMSPEEAIAAISRVLKEFLPLVEEDERLKLVLNLFGDPSDEKLGSMVHLWLATCMDEGVDPTRMCQSLVEKVAQSKQLSAVADPEVLALFESWLEELESEVISHIKKTGSMACVDIAEGLGLSRSGADFLITKLKREGRL